MLGFRKLGHGDHKVIALHGWFGDENTYEPMRRALTLDEFTYVFPAYRGYGLSKHLRGAYSIKEIATDVLALADDLGWTRFSLVGHSMGGMAVQRVLVEAPGRVRGIVAVTPVPASGVPFDPETWKIFEGAPGNIENCRTLTNFSTGGRHSQAWVEEIARNPLDNATREAFASYLQSWAKSDFSADVNGRPTPIKVIVGEYDSALTPEFMKATYLRWYPNSELEVIPNAGHYPMDETPIALATSVEGFLRKQAA